MVLNPWVVVGIYVACGIVFGFLIRTLLKWWLKSYAQRSPTAIAEILYGSLPRPVGAAAFLLVMSAEIRWLPLPREASEAVRKFVPLAFGVLAILLVVRVVLRAIEAYGKSNPDLRSSAGLGRAVTWVLGLAACAIYISDAMGVSLAPILTALGLGSLAIALALQDTLANFFAGLYLLADKPISPGDFIRVDTTHEGYVEAIGWRSTQLRTTTSNMIIVPNVTLSKAVITNFNRPLKPLNVELRVDVSNDADPDKVEQVLMDEAERALEIPGVEKEPAPLVRFAPGMLDGAFGFTVSVQIASYPDQGRILHELRKRVAWRLKAEKIPLPMKRT
jgi:small-conductance mechanosensitive channel